MYTQSMHICSVQSHAQCRRLLCSVEEQATLLREGLEEGGVHTDWATDWVQWSHSYRDTLGTHHMHTHCVPPSSPPPQLATSVLLLLCHF